jgi:2-dehydro-3-deoxy-L-rhamnonate dehydrogenase (NAD+)
MLPDMNAQDRTFDGFLAGTTIAITGGGSGIGRASAQLLAERGATVVVMDQDGEGLVGTVAAIETAGGDALSITGDITSSEAVQAAVDACLKHSGRIDGLVHCAGIGGGNSSVRDMSLDQWTATLTVNATGTFLMNRAVIAPMLAQGYGRIVNVASIAGLEGNPNAAHYSASKAAVIAFTKSLGKELAKTGVLVNAVAPAVIATEMLGQVTQEQLDFMLQKIPMGRPGLPSEAADLISFLVSPRLSFSTGAVFDLSGGRATY